MKRLLKMLSVLFVLAVACNVGYASSAETVKVGTNETEQLYDYTVIDPDTQQAVAELHSRKLTAVSRFEECGSLILESQKKIDNGEVTLEISDTLLNHTDLSESNWIHYTAFTKKNGVVLSSVSVDKPTEPEVMDEVTIMLV